MVYLFGCFEKNVLVGFAGVRRLLEHPVWILTKMVSLPNQDHTRAMAELYERCLNETQSQGLTEYFSCVPERFDFAHRRLWGALVPSYNQYEVITADRIPAREYSLYPHYRGISSLFPEPMVLRQHFLKEGYRERVISNRRKAWMQSNLRWRSGAQPESPR